MKEYLEKPDVWSSLLALTRSSGFNAILSLLRSSILLLKSQIPSPSTAWNQTLWTEIEASMALAVRAEQSSGSAQPELLRVLDQIISELWLVKRSNASVPLHWAAELHTPEQPCLRCPSSLLEFAIISGLTLYVKTELNAGFKSPRSMSSTVSLLDYATWYKPWYVQDRNVQPAMVAMLLESGYHPNENSAGSTPWKNLLKYIAHEARVCDRLHVTQLTDKEYAMFDSSWLDACRLFVMAGADLYTGRWDKVHKEYMFAWKILATAFEHLPGPPVLELQRMFEERGVDTSDGRGSQKHPHRHAVSGLEVREPWRGGPPTVLLDPCVSSTSRVRASYRNDGSLRQFDYQTEYPRSCSNEGLDALRHNSRQCLESWSPPSQEQYRMYNDDDGCSWRRQRPTHWCEQRQDNQRVRYARQRRPSSYWEGENQHDYLDNYDTERHPAPSKEKESKYGYSNKHKERRCSPSPCEDHWRRWHPY